MPRYHDIPTKQQFENDSFVWFNFRNADPTLLQIDRLLDNYHQVNIANKPDVLYYLFLAIGFWTKKINKPSINKPPTGFNDPANSLPTGLKATGTADRRAPILALGDIVETKLMHHHNCNDPTQLPDLLADAYECSNHEIHNDTAWMQRYQNDPTVLSVYMTTDGDRRRYKLRFRGNLAHRWADSTDTSAGYALYDTTSNYESELNDGMSHFVMSKNGRIYSGFEKDQHHANKNLVWFKHSSLVGGDDAASAGRMRVVAGNVRHIINDSGHYQPVARHMINILQRLAIYGQNIAGITIERVSDHRTFLAPQMLASVSSWPDGAVGH